MKSVKQTYDELAPDYHRMFGDWHGSVQEQGRVLDKVLRGLGHGPRAGTVLDCSCGIGTQSIGLALKGYAVHGTDISPKAVQAAKRHAKELGAKLSFGVADFLRLKEQVPGRFSVVINCDQAITHMLTPGDLLRAAKNMRAKLEPGGLLLISTKDYEKVVPGWTLGAGPFVTREGSRLKVQVQAWVWRKSAPVYRFHLFLLSQAGKRWTVKSISSEYRAWKQQELTGLLEKAGFSSIRWLSTKETGYRQPIVIAKP